MKNLILAIALPFLLLCEGPKENYLIVGTYTGGKSEGIYVYKFNSADGSHQEVSHIKASNPSFIVVSPDEKYVYAVNEDAKEGHGGDITAYSFNKENGTLTRLNQQPTEGDHPCYVDIDKTVNGFLQLITVAEAYQCFLYQRMVALGLLPRISPTPVRVQIKNARKNRMCIAPLFLPTTNGYMFRILV
jgi:hypothetical protein